jgi:hypothetical protein
LLEDWGIRVRILPQGKKILFNCFGGIAGKNHQVGIAGTIFMPIG